jgi:hypothetical protein
MATATAAAGRFAFIVAVGLGLGVLVGGVLGRLLMFVLIRLNEDARGRVSDDGFVMGQFTLSGSFNLVVVGASLGAFGGIVYAAARHLTFGPEWWRLTSVVLGAALPVGALIVHDDGVDFTVLEPPELAIAMFVLLPGLYGLLLLLIVERRLAPPAPSWQRLEILRWVLRAAAASVLAVSLIDLLDELTVLT